ncbi:hypothetical protein D9M72_301420 [compost metagenome]
MKDRPILFSAPMVRALLDGTKTQTRRVVKPAPSWNVESIYRPFTNEPNNWQGFAGGGPGAIVWYSKCPYGMPGDSLWVREAIRLVPGQEPDDGTGRVLSTYDADGSLTVADTWPWKRSYLPPMHCPRGLSRIDLEITEVSVERLQDISEADARAEGAPGYEEGVDEPPPSDDYEWSYRASFQRLWEQINGAGSWDANPWVWCVSFRRIR